MTDLVIRPLVAGEEHVFERFGAGPEIGLPVSGRTYRETVAKRHFRPEWTWVALDGDRVVARAAWWGGPEDDEPCALDVLDFTDPAAGIALLRASPLSYEYGMYMRPGWRDDPDVAAAVQARSDVAAAVGMRPLVERFHYRWTPGCGLPERPARLDYRPEPDDAAIHAALTRINHGTLDAHARRAIVEHGAEAAATEDLDILRWFPSPREWWRLAYTPGGDLVGLTVPARNYAAPCVGIIGVVPEHRGHGYAYDLLVECTHILVEQGAEAIVAATDQGNFPMAAAFAKAGYPIDREEVYLVP
jgi:RimJ/RimL family protein N-acetyltransferase